MQARDGFPHPNILLGKRNKEGASQIFSLTLLITVIVGLAIAAAAPFLAMPIENG